MTIFEMLSLLAGVSAVGLFVALSLIVNGSTKKKVANQFMIN